MHISLYETWFCRFRLCVERIETLNVMLYNDFIAKNMLQQGWG